MFNSRHPGPRRAWKGGSEQQSMTPLPRHPSRVPNCAKTTCFYGQSEPSTSPKPPWPKSSPEEALGGPRGAWGGSGGALGELWEALGEPVGGSGGALGELWEALYRKTPDQPHKRPLCEQKSRKVTGAFHEELYKSPLSHSCQAHWRKTGKRSPSRRHSRPLQCS